MGEKLFILVDLSHCLCLSQNSISTPTFLWRISTSYSFLFYFVLSLLLLYVFSPSLIFPFSSIFPLFFHLFGHLPLYHLLLPLKYLAIRCLLNSSSLLFLTLHHLMQQVLDFLSKTVTIANWNATEVRSTLNERTTKQEIR